MAAIVLRGDAAHLPLPDGSVDLIVTSPPYWKLRSYTDGGQHYEGQIGSEDTWQEYLEALWRCTAEWARVLKPEGSMFIDLGDKWDSGTTTARVNPGTVKDGAGQGWNQGTPRVSTGRPKSLLLLPERYRIGCVDRLGLIAREVIEWHKPNPLPESVRDRCARGHEDIVHLVKQPRYFAAVDEIREPHTMRPQRRPNGRPEDRTPRQGQPKQTWPTAQRDEVGIDGHPLGKLPGSVWEIPTQPLLVPPHLAVDHFAAFPMELPRRIILGWSPSGICTGCGAGRFPVADVANIEDRKGRKQRIIDYSLDAAHGPDGRGGERWKQTVRITGYACSCTPYTSHPGSGKVAQRRDYNPGQPGYHPQGTYGRKQAGEYERVGPWREYHLEGWSAPPTRPAVVVDPFCGSGTSLLVAAALGRIGVGVELSADYCRLARWRCSDPGERARALGVPKPPPVPEGQGSLFDDVAS